MLLDNKLFSRYIYSGRILVLSKKYSEKISEKEWGRRKKMSQSKYINITTRVFRRNIRILGPLHESCFSVFSRNAYELNIISNVEVSISMRRRTISVEIETNFLRLWTRSDYLRHRSSWWRKLLYYWQKDDVMNFSFIQANNY